MSGWCTNWSAYNVLALWQMVRDENDDRGWAQVQAWAAMEQAVHQQRARLLACRQTLMEKWPPDRSPAAQVFIGQLDGLIASMDEAVVAAGRTKHAINGIMGALAEAKRELAPLEMEYRAKSGDWTLRQLDGAEDELNNKARQIIARADQAVGQYTPSITPPPPYEARVVSWSGEDFDGKRGSAAGGSTGVGGSTGTGGGHVVPPPIPHDPPAPMPDRDPVMPNGRDWEAPVPSPHPPGSGGGHGGGGFPGSGGGSFLDAGARGTDGSGAAAVPGPVLTGVDLVATTPPTVGSHNAGPTSSIGTPVTSGPPLAPVGSGPAGGVPMAPVGGMPLAPGGRGLGRGGVPGSRVVVGGALPSGTVIGGAPVPRSPGGGIPSGGVIGAGPAAGAGRGNTGTMPAVAGGRSGIRNSDNEAGVDGKADNPWQVAEGVTPVIEPDRRVNRHDPGPGVIGMGQ